MIARAHDHHRRVLRRRQQGDHRGLVDHPPDHRGRWLAGREPSNRRVENRSRRRGQPVAISNARLPVNGPGLAVRSPCQHSGHRAPMHGRGMPGPPQCLDRTGRAVHPGNDPWPCENTTVCHCRPPHTALGAARFDHYAEGARVPGASGHSGADVCWKRLPRLSGGGCLAAAAWRRIPGAVARKHRRGAGHNRGVRLRREPLSGEEGGRVTRTRSRWTRAASPGPA